VVFGRRTGPYRRHKDRISDYREQEKTRSHIQERADAVVRGDMETVVADFSKELRPDVPQLAQALAQPVTSAEVLGVEVGDRESVARIRYSGDSGEVIIQTQWREVDGRPAIVHAELARTMTGKSWFRGSYWSHRPPVPSR
jgi:hypothetical protein